jgi:hypothetical protein
VIFELPVRDISGISFPWYLFGAGAVLTVEETRFRLSFLKPRNAGYAGPDTPSGAAALWRAALAACRSAA